MKIGVSGLHLYDKHYGKDKYKKIKEFGFDGVDFGLTVTEEKYYTLPDKETELLMTEEKRLADDAGVVIHQVHGPWRFPPKDFTKEDRCERMEKMKRSIYLTYLLGCKNWVIHPVMPFGINDIVTGKEKETREVNRKFFKELLETAGKYGVTICYENMPFENFSLSKPKDILSFVNEINDENFKVCLDTGHANVFGISAGDSVRLFGDKLKALHIHDNKMQKDLHLIPYMGTTDWSDFRKALSEVNFSGVFSLETSLSKDMPSDVFEETNRFQLKIARSIVNSTLF